MIMALSLSPSSCSASTLFILVLLSIMISSSLAAKNFTRSWATFYDSHGGNGNPSGSCGYEDHGVNMNEGHVTAVGMLYKNGQECGACYQVRCLDPAICTKGGVTAAVTDMGAGGNTDFILNGHAFEAMAIAKMGEYLRSLGTVEIEYQRVPCHNKGQLKLLIKKDSNKNGYIAFAFFNQGGKLDITGVEVQQGTDWLAMRRAYGAVWDINVPRTVGPLALRILTVDPENNTMKLQQLKKLIPANWKSGTVYDCGIRLD